MLIEAWRSARTVILIDAVHSGAAPGTIHRLDAHAQLIRANLRYPSIQAFGVAEAIELARALGQFPQHLIVYRIESHRFETAAGQSPKVERAAEQGLEQLRRQLGSVCDGRLSASCTRVRRAHGRLRI